MYEPSRAFVPIAREPARPAGGAARDSGGRDAHIAPQRANEEPRHASGVGGEIEGRAACADDQGRKHLAHNRYLYREASAVVKNALTGTALPMTTSMQLTEVLERIEARLKVLKMTENAASVAAGKPDAIRNLRRGVHSGRRKGISTATLAALAPVLKTSTEWLLTGRPGSDPEETAVEVVVSLPYADAILALTLAFEALRLGSDAECRILARAVLAASRTRQSPRGGPFSDEERRQLVSEAIRLFRTQ